MTQLSSAGTYLMEDYAMPNQRTQFTSSAFARGQDYFLGLCLHPDYSVPEAIAEFNLGFDTENVDLADVMIHAGTYNKQ